MYVYKHEAAFLFWNIMQQWPKKNQARTSTISGKIFGEENVTGEDRNSCAVSGLHIFAP